MRSNEVKQYTSDTRKVEGWFSNDAAHLFGWIDEIQKQHGINGHLFEIGCHHGKSAQLLGRMARTGFEQLAVCDLFGQQSGNVSNSGCGDFNVFKSNMQSIEARGVDYHVFHRNSTDLTVAEVGSEYRFFHIDGGHNPDEALKDLRLAAQCLSNKGVIVLDDPFRCEWPGVTEALIRFLDEYDEFECILVSCNKIILCRKGVSAIYTREIENRLAQKNANFGYPWKLKSLPFHSSNLRILYVPDYRQKRTLGNLIRRLYYATPLPYRKYTKEHRSAPHADITSKRSTA